MNEFKQEIKKRNEMLKHLEDIFLYDAVKSFQKSHQKNVLTNNLLLIDKVKYSSYFTRIWLNYLDKNQFEKILLRKLKVKY